MIHTKQFTVVDRFKRDPTPNTHRWQVLASGALPLDQQINNWARKQGVEIVGTSALGIHHYWEDEPRQFKSVIYSVLVLYQTSENASGPATTAAAPTADAATGDPTAAGSPTPGSAAAGAAPGDSHDGGSSPVAGFAPKLLDLFGDA